MFRRLAESFQDTNHIEYINKQDKYFKTIPNIIPSSTPGLKGFSQAIKSVDTVGQDYQQHAVAYPDDIFKPDVSPDLSNLASQCSSSSIDDLIAFKNPAVSIGCGWLYTPPNPNSPYPVLSKGFIGNDDGPLRSFQPPDHKKWFFDLQMAKKQMLIDKCKALKACTDVDDNVFKGNCGFCTDTNQGVPIDNVGKPLYSGDPLGSCNPESIITSRSKCPPPPAPGSGPQPIVDRTCEPVNGRLSAACLYRNVLSAGCSDNGALAISLSGSPNPKDYMDNLRNADSVKIYNRVANPPLDLDIFTQGTTTVNEVLKQVRQIAGNATKPSNTALGASARDLCLQKGSISKYDVCSELSDGSTSPFELKCLQQLFLKMGGQPTGVMYPTSSNIYIYNSMNNIGLVKQYIQQMISNMNSNEYNIQREAMINFLGITPEKTIKRAPYKQGVEVFWFAPIPGNITKVSGFLKRTIEYDIVQFNNGPSRVPQIGGGPFGCMVQLFDVRTQNNFSVKFRVGYDDGFWIAVNQPNNIDKQAFEQIYIDNPGLFGLAGVATSQSNSCTDYKSSTPNITKMYWSDAGGGLQHFTVNIIPCNGTPTFNKQNYSLTCETNAPFINYEVHSKSSEFIELRNPGLFSQFSIYKGLEYHVRSEEKQSVPGNKGFVRLNNGNSCINLTNIAYQSWKTVTFAIRPRTMPVKETFIHFRVGKYFATLISTPLNGNEATMYISHNFNNQIEAVPTNFKLTLNKWHLIYIYNLGNEFHFYCKDMDELISLKGKNSQRIIIQSNNNLYSKNGQIEKLGNPNIISEQCNIIIGTKDVTDYPEIYTTTSFNYDMAWVHFLQQKASENDILRECLSDWVYTQFPESYNKYDTR